MQLEHRMSLFFLHTYIPQTAHFASVFVLQQVQWPRFLVICGIGDDFGVDLGVDASEEPGREFEFEELPMDGVGDARNVAISEKIM